MKYKERDMDMRNDFRPLFIVMVCICVIIFGAGLLIAGRYVVNEFYNTAYAYGYYFDRSATTQLQSDLMEPFVAHYNTGNNHFQNGRYKDAMNEYMLALEHQPPHDDEAISSHTKTECHVRVNLALSMLYQIDFEQVYMTDRASVDYAIAELLKARAILTGNECAHFDDNNGHDADAEQLKKEIDEILARLNYMPDEEDRENDNFAEGPQLPQGEQEEQQQSQRERDLEKRLQDEMSDAKREQDRAMRENRGTGNRDGNGDGWYDDFQSW